MKILAVAYSLVAGVIVLGGLLWSITLIDIATGAPSIFALIMVAVVIAIVLLIGGSIAAIRVTPRSSLMIKIVAYLPGALLVIGGVWYLAFDLH